MLKKILLHHRSAALSKCLAVAEVHGTGHQQHILAHEKSTTLARAGVLEAQTTHELVQGALEQRQTPSLAGFAVREPDVTAVLEETSKLKAHTSTTV